MFLLSLSAYTVSLHSSSTKAAGLKFVEGEPTCIIDEGCLQVESFKRESIARNELFSQLRVNSISHLAQVRQAILETDGEVSIYYYYDEDVKYGVPIVPGRHETKWIRIDKEDCYSCTHCGYTQVLQPAPEQHLCKHCGKKQWVKSINERRIV